jgi:hypothetical protein
VRSSLVLLLVGVLLGGLLFGTDRFAQQIAESRVSHQLQTELGTPTPPTVTVAGFPFLTQLLRQSFDSVHVVADDVDLPAAKTVPLKHLDLNLHQVTVRDRFSTFDAVRVDGAATLDYEDLSTLIAFPLAYARDGKVEVQLKTTVVGAPITARIVGRPMVDSAAQTVTLSDPEITVAGVDVPRSTSQALLNTLLKPVSISGMPYGLNLTGVTADEQGLEATIGGRHVTFTR